jgi:hypothetical protein
MNSQLTIPGILAWADAWRIAFGRWPKSHVGSVARELKGTTWRQVDNALRLGLRGLAGGSSLAQLLAEQRGCRNVRPLPPLSENMIAGWASSHHQSQGQWPNENSGPVAAAPGEDWSEINAALRQGHRGLPGGDTLAKLIDPRFFRIRPPLPPLTVSWILDWADRHFEVHGKRPNRHSAAQRLFGGNSVSHLENRFRCKDGSYRWLHWTGQVIAGQQFIYCVGRDITDRKRVEEALRESEEAVRQTTLELARLRQRLECGGNGQRKQDQN